MQRRSEVGLLTHRIATGAVSAILAATVLAGIIWLPRWLVDIDTANHAIDSVHRLDAIVRIRQVLIQAVGGVAVLFGAYVSLQRLRINEAELQVSRDGQVTERFTRAIEQLGAGSDDVRIGAVHALERIALNSPGDRDAVTATLSAFVRGHSPWPATSSTSAKSRRPADLVTLATRANDVQSAVTALGRIPRVAESERPRLTLVNLSRARMWSLNFDGALFGISNLQGARMGGCSLVGADLGDCNLREVDLTGADLTDAMLWGADLSGAELEGAVLSGVKFDQRTIWPDGFDRQQHVLTFVREPTRHYRRL